MSFIDQYKRIVDSFNEHQVDYMVIGGIAVNYHGYSRTTMDMDIWVDTHSNNLTKLYDTFISLGFEESKCRAATEYLRDNHMIKIPLDKTKIELLDSFMVKIDFEESYKNHKVAEVSGMELKIIGFDDLIACKEKTNRMKDLLDVKNLREIRKLQREKERNVQDILKPKKSKGRNKGFSL